MTAARELAITALRFMVSKTRLADPRHDEYQGLVDDLVAGRQVIEPELPTLLSEPQAMMRALAKASRERKPLMIGGVEYVAAMPIPEDANVDPAGFRAVLALLHSAYRGDDLGGQILLSMSKQQLDGAHVMLAVAAEVVGTVRAATEVRS
jgi:hypothetical protein